MTAWRKRLPLICVAALLLSPVRCGNGWRQDELECQQAANQLIKCCPAFNAPVDSCSYRQGCEGTPTTMPGLSIADSQCVANMDCATLVRTNVCSRAQSALDGTTYDQPAQSVCP